jgi:hypothetical protein
MNMERSQLENIGNTQLFFLIKSIANEHSLSDIYRDIYIMDDNSFISACDDAGKIVGLELDFAIDHNYLAATIKLNYSDFDFSTSAHLYRFDIDEYRIEHVRRTYSHEMTSYSKELIKSTVDSMENEGTFDYYDGDEIDVDYYDGETTDVKFDKDSIRLIE